MEMNSKDSTESDKLLKHEFKDPHCYLCLRGTVLALMSLMQEVMGSKLTLFAKICFQIL